MTARHEVSERDALMTRILRSMGDRGASLVEYALLVALISVVCLGAIKAFGDENSGLVQGSANDIVTASGS